MKFTLRLTQSLRGTDDWGYPAETLAVSKLLLLVIHFRIRAVPRTPPSLTLTMKFTLGLAVVAAAVASATAAEDISALGAQRKLAFAPGYKGGMCNDMLCPDNYAPVCGSDGVTYSNECSLGITSCNHPEQNITMIGDGACSNKHEQQRKLAFAPGYKGGMCNDMLCPDNYAPVCGSDGVTYSNECSLGITSCNHPEQNITMIGDGACSNKHEQQRKLAFAPGYKGGMCNDMLCPDNYAPVCGSDGVTYSNECNLGITSCNHPEQNITMIGDGACSNE